MHDSMEPKMPHDQGTNPRPATVPHPRNWTEVIDLWPIISQMRDSSTFELIEDKARIRQLHSVLIRGGRHRLGQPHAATVAAISAIKELDRLERMVDATFTASNWQELLQTL